MVASCLSALHRAPPSRVVDSCFAISALRRAPPSRVVDSRFDIFSSALHVALLYLSALHVALLSWAGAHRSYIYILVLFNAPLYGPTTPEQQSLGGPQHMEQHSLERHISDTHGQESQPTRLGLVTRYSYTNLCVHATRSYS